MKGNDRGERRAWGVIESGSAGEGVGEGMEVGEVGGSGWKWVEVCCHL